MRNFLFTFKPFQLYIVKAGQLSVYRTIVNYNYFFVCKTSKGFFDNRISLESASSIRSLSQSVRKLVQVRGNDETSKNNLVYYGSLTSQIKGVKVFTCISSLGGIALQPWMIKSFLNGENVPLSVALLTCVGFFTFVTPFLIHQLTKKYVTEIQYNSVTDTYTATTLSFFLRRINFQFKAEDVTVPNMLPLFTTMLIKGKPVFIVSESFLEMDHYIKMMGYDKPIDLKLTTPDDFRKSEDKAKSEIM